MKKKGMFSIWLSAVWCVLALLLLGGATYAWFTFDPYTQVEPMSGTIGDGDVTLYIAADPQGEFKAACALPQSTCSGLVPVSTADLEHFYRAYGQDKQGKAITYKQIGNTDADMIHGTVYLKSMTNDCAVYLYLPGMSLPQDVQLLSALRLGFRIITEEGENTYIFALNELTDTRSAQTYLTTPRAGVVVDGIDDNNTVVYIEDPAQQLNRYASVIDAARPDEPKPGEQELCVLKAQEIASVEYWLYLEGCDENCINEVQDREVSLQLSFAGTAREDTIR